MRNIKRLVASALLVSAMFAPTVVQARQIRGLYFTLPAYQGTTHTQYARKMSTGGYTVMNINNIGGGSYAIDGFLANSGDSQRSEYKTGMMQYTRSLISNWSSARGGYDYRVKCINHNSVNYGAYITGSWSPDN